MENDDDDHDSVVVIDVDPATTGARSFSSRPPSSSSNAAQPHQQRFSANAVTSEEEATAPNSSAARAAAGPNPSSSGPNPSASSTMGRNQSPQRRRFHQRSPARKLWTKKPQRRQPEMIDLTETTDEEDNHNNNNDDDSSSSEVAMEAGLFHPNPWSKPPLNAAAQTKASVAQAKKEETLRPDNAPSWGVHQLQSTASPSSPLLTEQQSSTISSTIQSKISSNTATTTTLSTIPEEDSTNDSHSLQEAQQGNGTVKRGEVTTPLEDQKKVGQQEITKKYTIVEPSVTEDTTLQPRVDGSSWRESQLVNGSLATANTDGPPPNTTKQAPVSIEPTKHTDSQQLASTFMEGVLDDSSESRQLNDRMVTAKTLRATAVEPDQRLATEDQTTTKDTAIKSSVNGSLATANAGGPPEETRQAPVTKEPKKLVAQQQSASTFMEGALDDSSGSQSLNDTLVTANQDQTATKQTAASFRVDDSLVTVNTDGPTEPKGAPVTTEPMKHIAPQKLLPTTFMDGNLEESSRSGNLNDTTVTANTSLDLTADSTQANGSWVTGQQAPVTTEPMKHMGPTTTFMDGNLDDSSESGKLSYTMVTGNTLRATVPYQRISTQEQTTMKQTVAKSSTPILEKGHESSAGQKVYGCCDHSVAISKPTTDEMEGQQAAQILTSKVDKSASATNDPKAGMDTSTEQTTHNRTAEQSTSAGRGKISGLDDDGEDYYPGDESEEEEDDDGDFVAAIDRKVRDHHAELGRIQASTAAVAAYSSIPQQSMPRSDVLVAHGTSAAGAMPGAEDQTIRKGMAQNHYPHFFASGHQRNSYFERSETTQTSPSGRLGNLKATTAQIARNVNSTHTMTPDKRVGTEASRTMLNNYTSVSSVGQNHGPVPDSTMGQHMETYHVGESLTQPSQSTLPSTEPVRRSGRDKKATNRWGNVIDTDAPDLERAIEEYERDWQSSTSDNRSRKRNADHFEREPAAKKMRPENSKRPESALSPLLGEKTSATPEATTGRKNPPDQVMGSLAAKLRDIGDRYLGEKNKNKKLRGELAESKAKVDVVKADNDWLRGKLDKEARKSRAIVNHELLSENETLRRELAAARRKMALVKERLYHMGGPTTCALWADYD